MGRGSYLGVGVHVSGGFVLSHAGQEPLAGSVTAYTAGRDPSLTSAPFSVALPGPRRGGSGAGDPKRPDGTPCRLRTRVACGRSTHLRTAAYLWLAPIGSGFATEPHAHKSAEPAGFGPPASGAGGASPEPTTRLRRLEREVTTSHSTLRLPPSAPAGTRRGVPAAQITKPRRRATPA